MQDKIQDILNHKSSAVWCIAREATISEAAHRMREHGIGSLIVVGPNHAVGVVSEHEIVFGVLATDKDPNEVRVSAIMTSVPIVGLDTTIEAAIALAATTGAHQIVVVDAERIVGVIAAKEMTGWENLDQAFQISDLTCYITGRGVPPRHPRGLNSSEAPVLEVTCAYCGTADDDASWNLGVALCRSCAAHTPETVVALRVLISKPGELASPLRPGAGRPASAYHGK